MSPDVDLLVVGGGPVGLSTALLAAQEGLSVAVVEQRRDPVDKACGEGLMPGALEVLARLGVDPAGHRFAGIRYLEADGRRSAPARFSGPAGRGVRRTTLHAALAGAADRAGVTRVLERVDGVRQYSDRVDAAGVTGRYLAAADGLRSVVSRQYGLDRPARVRARFGLRRHYVVRPWTDMVEVHWAAGAEAYVTPLGAELVGVAVLTEHRGRSFDDWLTGFPVLAGRLDGAAPATSTLGAGPLERNVARRVVHRVLLVGDAAGYVDALTGEGIAVGIACAQRLVACVVANRPQEYEAGWRQVSRGYRLVTRGLLFAAQRPPLRAAVVPAAAVLPAVFARAVDFLAAPIEPGPVGRSGAANRGDGMQTAGMKSERARYGGWPSPVTAQMLTLPSLRSAEIRADGNTCWWSEARPAEGGRTQLVRRDERGSRSDVLPGGFNARTLVHEYGGGAWTVDSGAVVFSNFADQRIYRLDDGATEPVAISPVPDTDRGLRYGDLRVVAGPGWCGSRWVLAVRESHQPEALAQHGEPVNEIVAVPMDGSAADHAPSVVVLVSGPDFVASPCTHDDRIAWVQWDHPNMPFDNTSLWVADVVVSGGVPRLGSQHMVAGGADDAPESVMQPRWSNAGDLWFLSDRSNWWNLYRWDGQQTTHVAPTEAEIGHPAWSLGSSAYDFLADGRIVAAMLRDGQGALAVADPDLPHQAPEPVDCGLTTVQQVVTLPTGRVLTVAGGPTLPLTAALVSLAGEVEVLRRSEGVDLDAEWWSVGKPIEYPSADGRIARAVVYAPQHPNLTPPAGTRPPLLVILHGGPTGQTYTSLRYDIQYWTTRGFAVADVDYTGSTGYGRAYRRALYGRWGVVDVEDCLEIVRHLARQGLVDADRAAIRGGSAGGFTTLAALTHPDNAFATGASYFGVADLTALARETHKFESRYLDQLLGPLPEAADVYSDRSPITHISRLAVPLALFQGAEDTVVPPEQSRMIAAAAKQNGLACEYLEFAGEQHGFRKADSIIRAAETELAFYRRVFGPDDG